MSFNDLWNDKSLPLIMGILIIIVALVMIPLKLYKAKNTNKPVDIVDINETFIQSKRAKILAEGTFPHPTNQLLMVNVILFELDDGTQVELAIENLDEFGTMVKGDCGILRYHGKKFISFERDK